MSSLRNTFSLFIAAWALCGGQSLMAAPSVGRLRTEALKNPVGIDAENPAFSWTLEEGGARGVWQTAYQIRLYTDEDLSDEYWTSGKVDSQQQMDILYDGPALAPYTRYWWTVTVWDNHEGSATSTEEAYFETGLLGEGWEGAIWIQATDTPLSTDDSDEEETETITRWSVETDFEINNLSAGIIFAGASQSSYFMWQINTEYGYPLLRPHIWRGSTVNDATCLAEIDLTDIVNVEVGTSCHLRIDVDGDVAYTYIDGILVDTRTNPDGGNYEYGVFGFREDRALYDYYNLESAYFDNFIVTNLAGGETLINATFDAAENPFDAGTVIDGRLFVECTYAWYTGLSETVNYDLDMDFYVERQVAGIVFSAVDEDNLHMWSVNMHDSSTPILRRHVKSSGSYSSADASLSTWYTNADLLQSLHHIKIAVRGKTISTYLDSTLVDTYTDTSSTLCNGRLGFRTYHDTSHNEKTYYDNIVLTTYDSDGVGTVTFTEDFEQAGFAFDDGVVETLLGSKMLCVTSTYDESLAMQMDLDGGIPLFRKDFNVAGNVESAKVYASALGVFDLFINGQRVGHLQSDSTTLYDELKPGWTDYTKEVNYWTYDVTHLLQDGDNAIGAQVCSGWWNGEIARSMYGSPELGFLCRLRIEYEDGTVDNVVTSTDWASATCGPVRTGNIYNGEAYDARRPTDWGAADYDASGWCQVEENTDFSGAVTAFCCQSVRVRPELELTPASITVYEGTKETTTTYGEINVTDTLEGTAALTLRPGQVAQYDMAQNMAGWVRFTVKGAPGTSLRFKFGEMLNDTGDPGRANDGPGGSLYTYNLRTAEATLYYTLRGDPAGETFEPSTTFFGFRYVEVTASSEVEITDLTGRVVGSEIEETGSFTTSHADVNQLYSNILWGQRGNFLSIPMDCPQRDERLGWTADTQIFSRAASYNADTRAFYRKWMGDMRDSQRSDGAYPDMAPYDNFWGYGNAAWGDAGVIVPWTVYQMYGDTRILEENYESMSLYMTWLAAQSGDGYTYNGAGTDMGDWLAYTTTTERYVSVCYYAYVAQLMTEIASALGNTNDSIAYASLYENIKAEFQTRYVNDNGLLTEDTQCAYLLALKINLLPENAYDAAVERLATLIEENDYCLDTGFVGTGTLCQTLSAVGLNDLAYDLLLQRQNPSWMYSLDQGATTVWERWDSYTKESGFNQHSWIMNSFNHYAYGVVAEWMYRYVGGIEVDATAPGFRNVILQPTPDMRTDIPDDQERITHATATHRSPYGLISSAWTLQDDERISYECTIPAGSTATLYLPLFLDTNEILESGTPVEEAEGVELISIADGVATLQLQSGTYEFTISEGEPDAIEQAKTQALCLRPVPFLDQLRVSSEQPLAQICVTAMNGQTIYQSQPEQTSATITTSGWTPGLYVVQAWTQEGERLVQKATKAPSR